MSENRTEECTVISTAFTLFSFIWFHYKYDFSVNSIEHGRFSIFHLLAIFTNLLDSFSHFYRTYFFVLQSFQLFSVEIYGQKNYYNFALFRILAIFLEQW